MAGPPLFRYAFAYEHIPSEGGTIETEPMVLTIRTAVSPSTEPEPPIQLTGTFFIQSAGRKQAKLHFQSTDSIH